MTQYDSYRSRMQKISDLSSAGSVLSWDQQVYMPKNGSPLRSRQMATLTTMAHELFVDPDLGKLLERLKEDTSLAFSERKNVELTHKQYVKKSKYTQAFVETQARTTGEAFSVWSNARAENRFTAFAPLLKKIVDLKREEAEFLGYENHPYEALMDEYEPGLTIQKVDAVFSEVQKELFPFIQKILAKKKIFSEVLFKHYPKDLQWTVTEKLIRQMGYSFDSGRADFAPHPFCTTFSPGDVRITIRVHEHHFNQMLFAGIHEAGHALYEMGLPEASYGLPSSQAISLAFHESQSRLWENNVARSLPYWKANFAFVQKTFPEALKDQTPESFYRAVNQVEPSLIRVEADELTYHAHVYIRYLIEKALLENSIQVKDIPAFWNENYEKYLGIRPPNDTKGCLQDVHWAYGAFGYFPTYSLGSFYASQLMAQIRKENPNLNSEFERGEFSTVLKWLRKNIHQHGRLYDSAETATRVTGSELKFSYFMDEMGLKYGEMYGV